MCNSGSGAVEPIRWRVISVLRLPVQDNNTLINKINMVNLLMNCFSFFMNCKIMDNFQKEAASVANRSDLTQQQKGDEIRKINNKYQRQLNNLARAGSLQKI